MERQKERVIENIRRKAYDIERYISLLALQNRNERLFYRTLIDHIDELMPIVYTPTVGQACREFAHIFRQPRGFYVTPSDRGEIRKNLDNWPEPDVRVVVVTDGERILGLGDLGANGMGIPIGKLALYTACAGIAPEHCLPVMLDVGTNNKELLDDPLYLGVPEGRLRGDSYDELVDELITALQDKWPHALIQFEDFLTPNAYQLLNRYRDRVFCFNDDIQGTAAVALAGVYASTRVSGTPFEDLRIMFLGAGSAATGIADLTVEAFLAAGLSREEARSRLTFVDVNGLLVASRTDLQDHNLPYAHDGAEMGFTDALRSVRPHVLIGATGAPSTFTREVIETMAEINERPIIFALSNPTSRAECTAEQAYSWSGGRAVFASGSPFASVAFEGRSFQPGQGNNAYIFPGVGLGAVACQASRVSDRCFSPLPERSLPRSPRRGLTEVHCTHPFRRSAACLWRSLLPLLNRHTPTTWPNCRVPTTYGSTFSVRCANLRLLERAKMHGAPNDYRHAFYRALERRRFVLAPQWAHSPPRPRACH